MGLIKVFTVKNTKTSKLIKADTFEILLQLASEKVGFQVDRFAIKSDGAEIEDEEVFSLMVEESPKGLELVALAKGEEYEPLEPGATVSRDDFAASVLNDSFVVTSKDSSPASTKSRPTENIDRPSVGSEDGSMADLLSEWMKKKDKIADEMSEAPAKKSLEDSVVLRPKASKVADSVSAIEKKLSADYDEKKKPETKTKEKDYDEDYKREREEQERLERQLKEMENASKLRTEVEKTKALKERLEAAKRRALESKAATKTAVEDLELKVAKLELNNKRISMMFSEFKEAEKVDICFMVDCTGSMHAYINEAKTVIHRVVGKLTKLFQNLSLRFSFVGYRDHGDGSDRVTVFGFSQNADEFRSFVSGVAAKGGDDECEDVFGGLEEVIKLDWKNMSRMLLHIGDAPCHGARFHVGAGDSHPGGDPRGLQIENLLKRLTDLRITYYFTQINESTIKMIDEFNEELASLGGLQIKTVDMKSADGLLETVSKSISSTIFDSKSRSLSSTHGKTHKSKKLARLDWDLTKFKKVQVLLYKPIFDFSVHDLETTKIRYTCTEADMYVAPQPFAKGALRFAQAAYLVEDGARKKVVIKESMFIDPSYNTRKYVEESIECQVVAVYLAREFEEVSPSKKPLRFVDVSYIKMKDTGAFYSVEDYMSGTFFKMTNNAGYIDEESYSATLDSFMHWSHQFTNEYLVVTDLQGVRDDKGYTLTDPAITCPDDPDRFSGTNLGRRGLKEVFKTHRCNHMCRQMKLARQAFQESKEMRSMTPSMTQIK